MLVKKWHVQLRSAPVAEPEGCPEILHPGSGLEGPTPQGLKDFQNSFSQAVALKDPSRQI